MHPQPIRKPPELPRGLIFLGSVWLIGSWLLSLGLRSPIQPVSASYTPGVRMMLISVAIGLVVAWPLLRLSQMATTGPIRQTWLDLVSLIALVQVVIWPLRLVTPWSLGRTALMDATLTSWVILAGAVVASATGTTRAGPRVLAMATCLALAFLGPLIAWLALVTGSSLDGLISLSPVFAVAEYGRGGALMPEPVDWERALTVAIAAVGAWIAVGICLPLFARSEPDVRDQRSARYAGGDHAAP